MSTSVGTESEAQTAGKPGGPPEVQVSQPVAAPVAHVWEVLVSPAGSGALLGDGAVLGGKGDSYHCTDGAGGVLRSYHPLEQLRVSWHETPDGPPTIVEVEMRADGDGTVVQLNQNHLNEAHDVEALTERWRVALARLAEVAAQ